MTNSELAAKLIQEHSEWIGVDKHPEQSVKLWHVLISLLEWCDEQNPRVNFNSELEDARTFLTDGKAEAAR